MTILNASVAADEIILTMDTLVSNRDEENLEPVYFTQKFEYLPFADSIVCGTGNLDILRKVFDLTKSLLVREVDTLAEIVRDYAQKEFTHMLDETKYGTSTIYIFGFDEQKRTRAYAIRSTDGYNLQYIAGYDKPSMILKPDITGAYKSRQIEALNQEGFKSFIDIAKINKEYDDSLMDSDAQKVGVGGELVAIVLSANYNQAIVSKLYTFEDYEEQYQFALNKIHSAI